MQSYPIEAEYEDGYIHNEDVLNDISQFEPETRNVMYDISRRLPEAEHGKMVRFSIFINTDRLDIDWRAIPENAKPIRFKTFEIDQNVGSGIVGKPRVSKIIFGYEYLDPETGRNIQSVREIT